MSHSIAREKLQYEFSDMHTDSVYDVDMRQQKAKKILSVLDDYYRSDLSRLNLIDIGCACGIMTNLLSSRFAYAVGVDIDAKAILYAKKKFQSDRLRFELTSGMGLDFADSSMDVAVCAQVYEHVPDADGLFSEIYRILKPGGVCYFSALNKLRIMEPHYNLPFLSLMPKALAGMCLRIFKKPASYYYENLFTLWRLRELVTRFETIDYTLKVIKDPARYSATELLKPGSLKQKIAVLIASNFYYLCPTYVWLLRKRG